MFFGWLWVLYRGHTLNFLECVYSSLLYPSLIFDLFLSLCVCVCVCGVVLGFTNSYFLPRVWECVSWGFLCICGSVVLNLLVTFFFSTPTPQNKIYYGTQLKRITIFRHPYKNVNGQIITDINHKPTDTQQYLHLKSYHPKNCIKSIPYTLARRIHIIITD